MTADLVLRPFAWSDVPAITTIYRHYVENSPATFDLTAPGERAMADKFGAMVEAGHPVIVAEREGARSPATPTPPSTGRARPTGSPARIRSILIRS